MKPWLYSIVPPGGFLPLDPPKPVEPGLRGSLWVLSSDGECYGVDVVIISTDLRAVSFQTQTPLDRFTFGEALRWVLLVDGEVVAGGP